MNTHDAASPASSPATETAPSATALNVAIAVEVMGYVWAHTTIGSGEVVNWLLEPSSQWMIAEPHFKMTAGKAEGARLFNLPPKFDEDLRRAAEVEAQLIQRGPETIGSYIHHLMQLVKNDGSFGFAMIDIVRASAAMRCVAALQTVRQQERQGE